MVFQWAGSTIPSESIGPEQKRKHSVKGVYSKGSTGGLPDTFDKTISDEPLQRSFFLVCQSLRTIKSTGKYVSEMLEPTEVTIKCPGLSLEWHVKYCLALPVSILSFTGASQI